MNAVQEKILELEIAEALGRKITEAIEEARADGLADPKGAVLEMLSGKNG